MNWGTANELIVATKLNGSGRVLQVKGAELSSEYQDFEKLKSAKYIPIGRITIPSIEGTAYDIDLEVTQQELHEYVMINQADPKLTIPVALYVKKPDDQYIQLSATDQVTIPASDQAVSGNQIYLKVLDKAKHVPAGLYQMSLQISEVDEDQV
jgi:hypothetical protein